MHQTVRLCHTDHTDSIVSSMSCIFDVEWKLIKNRNLSVGYMVKIEAFENSHLCTRLLEFCYTDLTDSLVSSMACTFDVKK